MSNSDETHLARCNCGNVTVETSGSPIMTVACYCESCQKAGHYLERLPDAPGILDGDGGTHFLMCRKDRVRCLDGQEHLSEHRLNPDSSTRRVIAQCCNSTMFLEFEKGHWLSLYKNRFASDDQPPLDMRTMTIDRRPGVSFNDDIPSPKKHTPRFMWNLIKAWAAMGFKTPKAEYVNGKMANDREAVTGQ